MSDKAGLFRSSRGIVLAIITLSSVIVVFLFPPLPQPVAFHQFADTRELWGIPNFANVVSNLSFLFTAAVGLWSIFAGRRLLFPLVVIGIGSVLWWHYTEMRGAGDLRLYFLVQFYPMLIIPLLIVLYYTPAIRPTLPSLGLVVVFYALAKVLEGLDYPIYSIAGVSGHTLKHLSAALSTWYFVRCYQKTTATRFAGPGPG